jgi:transposase
MDEDATPQKQRKSFSPEVKLLAVKALEAGLTPGEVSEIVGAGNSSVTTWARAFREGGVEAFPLPFCSARNDTYITPRIYA